MRTETFVVSGGARIWTEAGGGGLPVLLCNGGPGCCDYLATVAAMLEDRALVIRWEQRGCGRSAAVRPYDVESCFRDLEAIREHYGLTQWVVAGHSWGADLAVAYAATYPARVLGVIGLSGGVIHKDRAWSEQYHRRSDAGEETEPDYAYPPNLEVNHELNASWKAYVRQPDLLRRLADLRVPALFVYGGGDIRPAWPVQQLAGLLPYGEFVPLLGAPHVLWLTHAVELCAHLRAFIRRLTSNATIRGATPADMPAILALEQGVEVEGAMWGFRTATEGEWAAHRLDWTHVAVANDELAELFMDVRGDAC